MLLDDHGLLLMRLGEGILGHPAHEVSLIHWLHVLLLRFLGHG